MIISKTPFRISFFGGGTDYPVWYHDNDGAVLSTTIDKYCYITCRYLPPFFNHKHRIIYSIMEHAKDVADIKHPSVRACLQFLKIDAGVEIHHDGDLPARTGLGSSSAFTVGLLNALYALKGIMITKERLANEAIRIEQDILKENVGSQDQIAATYGGFNLIEFGPKRHFQVRPVTIDNDRLCELQKYLMLFFTGFSRTASEIASEQIRNTPHKKTELKDMYCLVKEATDIVNCRKNILEFGKLLHENWKIKRSLTAKISNSTIDDIYLTARRSGATGGKLLGAGGGGFMLFFVRPELQKKVRLALKHLLFVPIKFENSGSQIIFYNPPYKIYKKD